MQQQLYLGGHRHYYDTIHEKTEKLVNPTFTTRKTFYGSLLLHARCF